MVRRAGLHGLDNPVWINAHKMLAALTHSAFVAVVKAKGRGLRCAVVSRNKRYEIPTSEQQQQEQRRRTAPPDHVAEGRRELDELFHL